MDLFNSQPVETNLQDLSVSRNVLFMPHLISSIVFLTLDAV